ncbi:hypothetical protein AHAS_Ahas11G0097100 [Arachis hypogaea]
MVSRRQGRLRTRGKNEGNLPNDNHAEFMAAMTNLTNTMKTNATTTAQAMERMGHGNGNGNGNGEAVQNGLGGAVLMMLATFLKVNPPSFKGSTDPTEVDNWFQSMERALQAQHIPENQFVEFAAYQLLGEAQHWWQGECRLMQLKNGDIPWELFQTLFYKKYFLELMREARELELMQLKMEMHQVPRRLKDDIMTAVAPLEIRRFSELVNKARVVEEYARKMALTRDARGDNND